LTKKYTRAILAIESDQHGGSQLGLLNPDTVIKSTRFGNKKVELNELQEHLHNIRDWGMKETLKLADKDPIYVFNLGDVTQGIRFPIELISARIATQVQIAAWNSKPWLHYKNVKGMRWAEGTENHVFGEGTAEHLVEMVLSSEFKEKDLLTVHHGLTTWVENDIDYSHHGPSPGTREWTKGNVARLYLRDLMMIDASMGKKPPDLVLRGHFHEYIKEFSWIRMDGKEYESWLYILPSFSFPGEYTSKATKSKAWVEHGMIAVEIINGKICSTYKFSEMFDTRHKETIL
jgi:hypothetical protein